MNYIKFFDELTMKDALLVGGKNATLGQMYNSLSGAGIRVPYGFAVTAPAYWEYVKANNLLEPIKEALKSIGNGSDAVTLAEKAGHLRKLFIKGTMPKELVDEIKKAYKQLSEKYGVKSLDVAIRSSATAEDLPTASFAGQHDSFLNIHEVDALIDYCKHCYASLFNDRAIMYRIQKGFDHLSVALSIGIQKMVRSDKACAGVAFSLDTETGFDKVITINGSYGLGEAIVQGAVIPDEFVVYKPLLKEGYAALINKKIGDKRWKFIYAKEGVKKVAIGSNEQLTSCLTEAEVLDLARMVLAIDEFYSEAEKRWTPVDVEWAKDGKDGLIYIVQSRFETVHSQEKRGTLLTRYELLDKVPAKALAIGQSIGQQIKSGTARLITNPSYKGILNPEDIIVTNMTNPDWVPLMKKVAGIITQQGGRTCHAAIVSRELGIPAIVGCENATKLIKDGQKITLDCTRGSVGYIYDGALKYKEVSIELEKLNHPPVDVMINLADPDSAFGLSFLPVAGIGLARMEFIINNTIKIHPMALIHPEKVIDKKIKKLIDTMTKTYHDKKEFFVDKLAYGVATIAAAFYPRSVIVRFSDFKSNEYRDLIGGSYFEPIEENPMIGLRGAFRYYHAQYQEGFALECKAIKKVREQMGLTNVQMMIPFIRTINEAKKVIEQMANNDLAHYDHGLKLVMMCELPSNVILIDDFCQLFDSISIGSNDLTQLTLGVDRDSGLISGAFDERDPAVKKSMAMAIQGARRHNKPSGICGQAPSDYPEIADFLIKEGINSISLNPDVVVPFMMRYSKKNNE